MLDVAALTDQLEAFSWTDVSRQEALRAAHWLREQASRIRRRVESSSGDLPLGRLRVRTLRLERIFNELGMCESRLRQVRMDLASEQIGPDRAARLTQELNDQLDAVRAQLRVFHDEGRARKLYDDLAQILRDLTERETRRGRRDEAERYQELARRFEQRLDAGEFDQPRPPEEDERDRGVLAYFQELLDEPD